MIELPAAGAVPVLRVNFSNETVWDQLKVRLATPTDDGSGYEPQLEFVERRDLAGMSVTVLEEQIPRAYPASYEFPFLIVVDDVAVNQADHPVLLVDLHDTDTSPSFRALPREIASIEANLSLANMDFLEFRNHVDETGVFRGWVEAGAPTKLPWSPEPTVRAYEEASSEHITIALPPDVVWEICEDLSDAPTNAYGVGREQIVVISREILRRIEESPVAARPEDPSVVTLSARQWAFIRERAVRRLPSYRRLPDQGWRAAATSKVVALIGLRLPL